jgi:HEAT repeat protein
MSSKLTLKPAALLSCALIILLTFYASALASPQQQDDAGTAKPADASVLMRQLTDRDAFVRQRAAEDLARLADPKQRKLVEGYRFQEKHPRVRLALDWALYRMGKPDALYTVVRDLDSTRYNQSEAYLAELETPEPLYTFLPRTNGNTQVKLLEALARNGNGDTLEIVRTYEESPDPKIADAARFAKREITRRLGLPQPNTKTRTRQTGNVSSDTP